MIFSVFFPAPLCPAVLQLWSASLSAWNSQHGRAEMGIPACCVLGVRENVENPAELNCVHTKKIRDGFFKLCFWKIWYIWQCSANLAPSWVGEEL